MQILFCIGGWRCRFSPAGRRGASLSLSAGYWPQGEDLFTKNFYLLEPLYSMYVVCV